SGTSSTMCTRRSLGTSPVSQTSAARRPGVPGPEVETTPGPGTRETEQLGGLGVAGDQRRLRRRQLRVGRGCRLGRLSPLLLGLLELLLGLLDLLGVSGLLGLLERLLGLRDSLVGRG